MEELYVRNRIVPVLRNMEIENRYKKIKTEIFEDAINLSVNVTHLTAVRLYLLDENQLPV